MQSKAELSLGAVTRCSANVLSACRSRTSPEHPKATCSSRHTRGQTSFEIEGAARLTGSYVVMNLWPKGGRFSDKVGLCQAASRSVMLAC